MPSQFSLSNLHVTSSSSDDQLYLQMPGLQIVLLQLHFFAVCWGQDNSR